MQSKSVARELALLILGQHEEKEIKYNDDAALELLLSKALESLTQHWREGLDDCAEKLEIAQQELLDSELKDFDGNSAKSVRDHLNGCVNQVEIVLNGLSTSLELPRLLTLSDHEEVRVNAIQRVNCVINQINYIDNSLDSVMEGWRLHRLPRIDRDILRLAVVDISEFHTPLPVACNEAVELANRYSDEQGRKMINGILRRYQTNNPLQLLK